MKIENQNKRDTERIVNIILNVNENTKNKKQEIDNLINYQNKNSERYKKEERKEIKEDKKKNKKGEKVFNFCSDFQQTNNLYYNAINNFISTKEICKNTNIEVKNKLNGNNYKNKNYNLLKNKIVNNNYFDIIIILFQIINIFNKYKLNYKFISY